jgi:uncharacterized lipoprotein NlpE involved in copper resistance
MKGAKALVLTAAVVAFSLVGCSNDRVLECDLGDQVELDSDCGYWRDSKFNWYNWVVQGETSYSPKGFEATPDDETAPADSGGSGHKAKPKRGKH